MKQKRQRVLEPFDVSQPLGSYWNLGVALRRATSELVEGLLRIEQREREFPPSLRRRCVTLIKTGAHPEVAAVACGIHRDTYYEWIKRGNAEESGAYRDFAEAIGEAMAKAEVTTIAKLRDSRRNRNSYSRRGPK